MVIQCTPFYSTNILFFRTLFNLQALTLAANRNDFTDSLKQSSNGATFMNISVFELPPRLGISKCVSFEFRYGTWSFWFSNAIITFVSSLSDRLMFFVSSMRLLVFGLSEPAKSIKLIFPTHFSPAIFFGTKENSAQCVQTNGIKENIPRP